MSARGEPEWRRRRAASLAGQPGGGLPFEADNHNRVLEVFADHIARDDPATKRVLFDLSYVPAPEEGKAVISALVLQMRRIGIDRFLFGSDYNVLTPAEAVSFIERLGLTEEEQDLLRHNCAPWVCPDTAQALGTEYSLRGDNA